VAAVLPERLLQGLVRVHEPGLRERCEAALAWIGIDSPKLESFHLDAAGYSPEIADALGDPYYLGRGPLAPCAVIASIEQLRAPLLHPGLGHAAHAWRALTARAATPIAALTLREPLVAEIQPVGGPPASPFLLADMTQVEIRFGSPGGLVRDLERLEAMQAEFLASDRLWLDDAWLEDLRGLAERVRRVDCTPDALRPSVHPLALFYVPAFGGSYVLEERGVARRRSVVHVLSRGVSEAATGVSPAGHRVHVQPLDALAALRVLLGYRIVRFMAALRDRPDPFEDVAHWAGADHLLRGQRALDPEQAGPAEVARRMRGQPDVPADYRELAELARHLQGRGEVDLTRCSPLTQVRLLEPASSRADVQSFVRHLQAFLDPANLGAAWDHAPDLLFARLPALPAPARGYLAAWLARRAGR